MRCLKRVAAGITTVVDRRCGATSRRATAKRTVVVFTLIRGSKRSAKACGGVVLPMTSVVEMKRGV